MNQLAEQLKQKLSSPVAVFYGGQGHSERYRYKAVPP
jgi:hypothetical protein